MGDEITLLPFHSGLAERQGHLVICSFKPEETGQPLNFLNLRRADQVFVTDKYVGLSESVGPPVHVIMPSGTSRITLQNMGAKETLEVHFFALARPVIVRDRDITTVPDEISHVFEAFVCTTVSLKPPRPRSRSQINF